MGTQALRMYCLKYGILCGGTSHLWAGVQTDLPVYSIRKKTGGGRIPPPVLCFV